MARKTEVYTWRVSPALKASLEEVAREFVESGVLSIAPLSDRDLPDLLDLMRRYHDRPMDFADATLVHIAQRESLSTVFTVDHDDFETYRIGGRKRFRILPER